MTKNGIEFQIGWRDFPLVKDDTWEQWRGWRPRRTVAWLQRVKSAVMLNAATSFRFPTEALRVFHSTSSSITQTSTSGSGL
jgi:hypothetical protein